MIKMIVQKKTINNIIKDNYRKALSIQFSLGGFSFCISNLQTKEIQNFTSYTFDTVIPSPEALLTEIEALYIENTILKQAFESITIIHQNNLSTLVPAPLFDENELHVYLDYNIKTLANDYVAFDTLTQLDIKNVYVPYVNINNFFFQKFGEFDYKHHATVLIDKLILHSKNNSEKKLFVNVTNNNFDIVVVENSKLLFYNSFSFRTKEDFIYYILFTAEQLQLNPEELLLYFIGNIEEESELYHTTYQYIRNVAFIKIDNTFFDNEKDISNHTNYITTP
ncbi:MAG: hypothetical protein ACI9SI_000040 [Polaribacter sp.]|jgi:hypothetical protein